MRRGEARGVPPGAEAVGDRAGRRDDEAGGALLDGVDSYLMVVTIKR
ncbi:MAG: hypothetical protein H0X71_10590 [Rubrobacter sp.]|nr:hypothetical protein [Rubrobacter sp.]